MKLQTMSLIGLMSMLLFSGGCEREISGNVPAPDNNSENCLLCHSGLLDQAQGEWANSVHASGASVDYTNRDGSDCMACHDQQGFVEFLATGSLSGSGYESVSAIGCFTCHNPHETGDLSLRTTAAYTLKDGDVFNHGKGNLCVNCHHSRTDVRTIADNQRISNRFGPHHGPQGDLLNGSGGFEFPGEGYGFPSSPHRLVVEDACIGCHMGNPQIHDGYAVGGHSWNMEDEETGTNMVATCADASCHGSSVKSYDFKADHDYDNDGEIEGYQTEIAGLLDSLGALLYAQDVVDDEYTPVTDTVADANLAGAVYNFVYVEEDRSEGIHNFKYAKALLDASIDYVSQLPLPAPPGSASEEPGPVALMMLKSH